MNGIKKSYRYRIYPTAKQEQDLMQHCGNTRMVWNYMLALNKETYKETGKFVFRNEMSNLLPMLKNEEVYLQLSIAQSLQQVCVDFDQALKRSFNGISKFPRLKKRGISKDSFRIVQKFKIKKTFLKIHKIGLIKMVGHRKPEGEYRFITISKDVDQWYVSLTIKEKSKNFQKLIQK